MAAKEKDSFLRSGYITRSHKKEGAMKKCKALVSLFPLALIFALLAGCASDPLKNPKM
jgi:hypothetical protein